MTAATVELEAATAVVAAEAERYDMALQRWLALGGADLDARIGPVWADLGLDDGVLDQDMTTLSGGQAARTSLAAILLAQFDVFLLDEPTNDLDFDGLDRLEGFLDGLAGAAMIVSHDRAFLERTITSVLELDEHSHRGRVFAGGWLAYLEEHATARRHAEEAYDEYHDKRRDLEDRARSQRQWAVQGVSKAKKNPKDNDKAQRDFRLNRTEKQAAKVRVTEKALDRLDVVEKPWEGWQLQLSIATAPRSGGGGGDRQLRVPSSRLLDGVGVDRAPSVTPGPWPLASRCGSSGSRARLVVVFGVLLLASDTCTAHCPAASSAVCRGTRRDLGMTRRGLLFRDTTRCA